MLLQSHLIVVAIYLIGNSLLMNGTIAVLATFAASVIGHHLVLGTFARMLAMMMMRLVLLVLILVATTAAMPCAMGHHNFKAIQSNSFLSESCLMDVVEHRGEKVEVQLLHLMGEGRSCAASQLYFLRRNQYKFYARRRFFSLVAEFFLAKAGRTVGGIQPPHCEQNKTSRQSKRRS